MKKRSQNLVFAAFAVCGCLFLCCVVASAQDKPAKVPMISEGMNIPEHAFDAVGSSAERKYLGVKKSGAFSLCDVKAKINVVEFFSFYCTHCRKQAEVMNEIYRRVQKDKTLSDNIKMIGINAAGDQKQTETWRDTHHVPFPLVPDPEQVIYKKYGRPPVPCTLFVDGCGKVLAVHLGAAEDTDVFFRQLTEAYQKAK
jgi:peroxiredoxin